MDVYFLRHVRHAPHPDGAPVEHRSADGVLGYDDEHDEVRMLGVYSSRENARAAADRARDLPEFADEPDCFFSEVHAVDTDAFGDS